MVSYPYALTLVNPGAETGDMTGWSSIAYDIGQAQRSGSDVPSHSGNYYFDGAGNNSFAWWGQTVQLPSEVLADVDTGTLAGQGSVWFQGYSGDSDNGRLILDVFDANGNNLSYWSGPYVDPSSWVQQVGIVDLPAGARSIRISVQCVRNAGSQISIYMDDFELSLVQPNTDAVKSEQVVMQVAAQPLTGIQSELVFAQIATQATSNMKVEAMSAQIVFAQPYRPLLPPGRRRGGSIVF